MDFRFVRFLGVILVEIVLGGGIIDYVVYIFYEALRIGKYKCYLRFDIRMLMIYFFDCLRVIVELLEVFVEKFNMRIYNISVISFIFEELVEELKKYILILKMEYEFDER